MSRSGSRDRSESNARDFLLGYRNFMSTEASTRCCRSAICVTSKAAFCSLAWSFGVNLLYDLFYQPYNYVSGSDVWIVAVVYAAGAIFLSFYPLAGFLADNKFGRYKTIARSLQIIIVSIIVIVPSLFIFYYFVFYSKKDLSIIGIIVIVIVAVLVLFPMTAACIGFNANVIQFGMDQLHDSPADHQRLFIHWYIWIYYFVLLITRLPWKLQTTVPNLLVNVLLLIYVVLAIVLLAVFLVLAFRRKHWFIIDMGRINPYKMVYRVSKFAKQHKVPIYRSAFTYCEDELPTGLDLGKRKYGGPFTTEEVEDVKVFYEILKLLLSLGPTFFLYIASDPALQWYVQHTYYVPRNAVQVSEEYWNNTIDFFNYSTFKPYNTKMTMLLQSNEFSYLLIVILLPLYLCTLRSILFRYMPSMTTRIGIGIIFSIMSLISTFVLDTIAHFNQRSSKNCMFVPNSGAHLFEDITLTIIPRSFTALSDMFIYIALYEFICAQSPHSMKGFLIGLSFAIKGLFQTLAALLIIPFSFVTSSFPSCGMYYYIMNISVGMLALFVYVGVARRYKYRKRDEICDIYRYAEEYYSNGN